jgi:RNA polymerase sigma-70 factor (ECF subfamily)
LAAHSPDKDERSFETLVRSHQGHIRAFLRRVCKNAALADDLAQETFLRAYQKYGQLKDQGAAKSWLFQIAYRVFLDYIRKENRRKGIDDTKNLTQGDMQDMYSPANPATKMDVEQAMNALPHDQRAALMLSFSYGLSHLEIAQTLDQPLGTVKSHISRGKLRLRASLRAYEKA